MTAPTQATTTVSVTCCGECPFVVEPDDEADRWMCSAVDQHRDVRALADPDFHPWRTKPPRWCPLRRADQLVRLETRTI